MRLVVTPGPQAIEVITGYLHTLTEANGYPSPRFLLGSGRTSLGPRAYRDVSPEYLADLTGMDATSADRVCVTTLQAKQRSTRILGKPIHNTEIRMDPFRICPLCIASGERHAASWHLKVVNWCTEHRIRLLERCDACQKPIVWNRPGLARCRCGADLTAMGIDGPTCSDPLWRLTCAVENALYDDIQHHVPRAELGFLSHLDPYLLSRFILVLSEQIPPGNTHLCHGRRRQTAFTMEQLEGVAAVLDDWPHNFQKFLHRLYGPRFREHPSGTTFRSSFHWVWSLGAQMHDRDNSVWSFLREEVYRFASLFLSKDQMTRRDSHHLPATKRWGSVPEAAVVANMDQRTLLKRVRSGDIPSIASSVAKRNRVHLVDLDWIRKQQASSHPPLHVRVAANRLGISVALLRALKVAEIYVCRHQLLRGVGFSVEDVNSFSATLDSLSAVYSADGSVGGTTYNGVNLAATKSISSRVEMLRKLKELRPNFWEQGLVIRKP